MRLLDASLSPQRQVHIKNQISEVRYLCPLSQDVLDLCEPRSQTVWIKTHTLPLSCVAKASY